MQVQGLSVLLCGLVSTIADADSPHGECGICRMYLCRGARRPLLLFVSMSVSVLVLPSVRGMLAQSLGEWGDVAIGIHIEMRVHLGKCGGRRGIEIGIPRSLVMRKSRGFPLLLVSWLMWL